MNSKPKTLSRELAEGMLTLSLVGGCCIGLGFYFGQESNRQILVDERADKIAEIARLQTTHAQTISALSGKTATAAIAAGQAAAAVGQAAETVNRAAETAQAASTLSAKAAKAVGVPAAAEQQNRRNINRAVDSANSKINQ